MKNKIAAQLSKLTSMTETEIIILIEIPPSQNLGDYAFPCFSLAKAFKNSPNNIAQDLAKKFSSDKNFEKVEANGPYINFFINRTLVAETLLKKILKEKDKYGSSNVGKDKNLVIEFSSPNIAKPFGIGHLRSTIIGNSIANIGEANGYKTIRLNYLGDWGTPFGKIILGYKKFGREQELKKNPIKHLLELYIKISSDEKYEQEARDWFKKLENGDKDAVRLWKKFRALSIVEFKKIYSLLNVKFDVFSGESFYNKKIGGAVKNLQSKNLLKESEGAQIVDLEEHGLGIALIKKSDGATLYITRDLAAAVERHEKYKFEKMIYEVGAEQKLHFKQLFKILELLGYDWFKDCIHVEHGLYLDADGKKFATRKGKTIFMEDIINDTKELAKKELQKRFKLQQKELEKRALAIAISAIIYGDLKNHRAADSVFDIQRFVQFEGNTGPYLLYTYARARSILKKAKKQKGFRISKIDDAEKYLLLSLQQFPEIIEKAWRGLAPNIVANYAHSLAQKFNEFYHENKVLGSENESFRIALVAAFCQVLKNALQLLAIQPLERM